ncbi:hypothetical protein IAT38_000087 [Cryptococcus sp. DSM 104549]
MSLPSLAFALVSLGGGIITGALTGPYIFAPCWDPVTRDSGACAQRLRTFRSVFSLKSTVYAAVNAFQSITKAWFNAIIRSFLPTVLPSDTACLDGAGVDDPQCMIPLMAVDPAFPDTVNPGDDTQRADDKDKVYWYNRPLFDMPTSIGHESSEDVTLGDYATVMAASAVLIGFILALFRRCFPRYFRTARTAPRRSSFRAHLDGNITDPFVDLFPPFPASALTSPGAMQVIVAASAPGEDDEYEWTDGSDNGYDSDNVLIDLSNLPFHLRPTTPTSPDVPSKTPRRDAAKAELAASMRTMPWAVYGLPTPDFSRTDRFGFPLKVNRSTRGKSPMMDPPSTQTSPLDPAFSTLPVTRSSESTGSGIVNKDKVTTALDKGKPARKSLNASAPVFQPGTKYVQVKVPSDAKVGGNGYTGKMGTGGDRAGNAGQPVLFSDPQMAGAEKSGATGGDRARDAGQPDLFSEPLGVGVENQGVMPTGGDRDAGQPILQHTSEGMLVDGIAEQLSAFKIHINDTASTSSSQSPASSGSLTPPSADVTTPDSTGTTALVDVLPVKAAEPHVAADLLTSYHSDAPQDLLSPPEHGSKTSLNAMNKKAEIDPLAAVESGHARPPACLDLTAVTASSSTASSSDSVSTMSQDNSSVGGGQANHEDVEMASDESDNEGDGGRTPTGIAPSTTKHSDTTGGTTNDAHPAAASRSLAPTPGQPTPQHNPTLQPSSGYYLSPTMTPATDPPKFLMPKRKAGARGPSPSRLLKREKSFNKLSAGGEGDHVVGEQGDKAVEDVAMVE